MSNEFRFIDLACNFPPYIPRTQIQTYFPWLSSKRLANLDCKGEGPLAVRNGRAVIYPTKAFLTWLDSRNDQVQKRSGDEETKGNQPTLHEEKESFEKSSPRSKSRRGRKTKRQEVRERRGLEP